MCNIRTPKVALCCLLVINIQISGYTAQTQDQTSSRTNTLFDDADDIQRQLDNEARDRIKLGRPKTIWVFHFPTHFSDQSTLQSPVDSIVDDELARFPREYDYQMLDKEDKNKLAEDDDCMTPPLPPYDEWDYSNQAEWVKTYPNCGGKSQSPVELPITGLIHARGARNLSFQNYDVLPKTLTLVNDGKRVVLYGEWKSDQRPLIYGGAAHSRRYLFHSLTVHLPSEHTVAGLIYPMETQALFVSAEYQNMEEALESSPSDPQAFLAVANLFKYSDHTHKGLNDILKSAKDSGMNNVTLKPKPLSHFNPPFKEYACYQGSMTLPPCTESVLWLIRGRALSISRETADAGMNLLVSEADPSRHIFFRSPLPLNDRKVYLFK